MKLTFREIALQHLSSLYGYAMTLTGNQSDAEDLVQETYLRAIRAYEQLRPDSNVKGWMFTILRNLRLNQIRRTHSGPRIVEMDERVADSSLVGESPEDPLESYLAKLKQNDVRNAIESLPPRYREVILLREFEDFSYQQIAEVLDCPTGTVMSRLGRAREKLKEVLQEWSLAGTAPTGRADRP